ncbi:MAG: hypothetical protein ACI80K_004635, partial [Paracoccaceae bacterium]
METPEETPEEISEEISAWIGKDRSQRRSTWASSSRSRGGASSIL